jgi:hypothetical protein
MVGWWWWYSGACEQGLGAALLYAHREGEVELGATQRREAQPGQGRGKGAASPARRGSAVGNRRPRGTCASGMGGFGAGMAIWSQVDWGLLGTILWCGSPAGIVDQVAGGCCPLMGQNREGERREREGERKGLGFKLNFLKISNRNLKNFEHESCRKFENLQLLLDAKIYLSHSLKVILNSRLLGFELLVISCVKF